MAQNLLAFFLGISLAIVPKAASVQFLGQLSTANPLLCSFSDDATGFYASWHSNCSGLINFLVNVRNFPRPDVPGAFGLVRDMPFGHFWTAIGLKFISTELALIENLSGPFVSVSPARLEGNGRPPQREIGGGILINPRGSFIGSTLEATFAVDASLFGTGCREFLFFTALTPVGAPYGAIPFSKTVCDVARSCARFQCPGDVGAFPSQFSSMPMPGMMPPSSSSSLGLGLNPMAFGSYGTGSTAPFGGRMPPMDYFDADYIGQLPAQAQQSLLATASALTNPRQGMMGGLAGTGILPYQQMDGYYGSGYGQYGNYGQYGGLGALYGQGLGQYGQYGQYGLGQYGLGQYDGIGSGYGQGSLYGQYGLGSNYGQYGGIGNDGYGLGALYGQGLGQYGLGQTGLGQYGQYGQYGLGSLYGQYGLGQYGQYGQYGLGQSYDPCPYCPPGTVGYQQPASSLLGYPSSYASQAYWPQQQYSSMPYSMYSPGLISPLAKDKKAKRVAEEEEEEEQNELGGEVDE